LVGVLLDGGDEILDLLGALLRVSRQRFDLVGDDSEPFAGLVINATSE